jgi:hypothetical protein
VERNLKSLTQLPAFIFNAGESAVSQDLLDIARKNYFVGTSHIQELAAGSVQAGPYSAAPTDFDHPAAFGEHEQYLLARLQRPAMQDAESPARDIGRQNLAFHGLRVGLR